MLEAYGWTLFLASLAGVFISLVLYRMGERLLDSSHKSIRYNKPLRFFGLVAKLFWLGASVVTYIASLVLLATLVIYGFFWFVEKISKM